MRRRPILNNKGVVEAVGERKTSHTDQEYETGSIKRDLVITTKAPMVETLAGHGTQNGQYERDIYLHRSSLEEVLDPMDPSIAASSCSRTV